MYPYDRNMLATRNHKYANASLNYCAIMTIQNFQFFAIPGTKCQVEANNNREAVVVCARHVVKRPSKRSPLVCILDYFTFTLLCNFS